MTNTTRRPLGQRLTDTAIETLRQQIADLADGADLDTLDALIAVLDEKATELVERRDAMVAAARPVDERPVWAVNRFASVLASEDRKAARS